jgi:hypothetical protein
MKKFFALLFLLSLLLAACQTPTIPLAATATVPVSLQTQALNPSSTVTLAPFLVPSSTPAPTASPASPLPSATSGVQATAGAGQAAAFKDCALLPGLPACGGKLPLTGKLALIDPAGKFLALVDFKAGTAWQEPSPSSPVTLSFSPSGRQAAAISTGTAGTPSTVYDVGSGKVARSVTLQGLIGWTAQDDLAGSPFRTVWSAAGDQAWIDFNTAVAHLRFAAQPDKDVTWPVTSAPTDRIAQAVDWVPGTDLLLFELHAAGNSMWITGGSLYTLNVKNGAIKDLRANMALTFHFQWQPSAKGVMVYGDTTPTPGQPMGGQSLFVLNVVSASRKSVDLKTQVSISAPAFTPDGQSILFGASLPADQSAANSPFTLAAIYLVNPATGKVSALTQPPAGMSDTRPLLLPDGQNFLFYRVDEQQQTFSLRLGFLGGGVDQAVTGSLSLPARTGPEQTFDSVVVYQP